MERNGWDSNHELQGYAQAHGQHDKQQDTDVVPFVLGSRGITQNLFARNFISADTGPLVLVTVIVNGNTYTVNCEEDLILFRINTSTATSQVVTLPAAASCPGGFFIVKDDLRVAGTANPHNSGVNYKIQVQDTTSTIDGASNKIIENAGGALWLLSDGTSYHLLEVF